MDRLTKRADGSPDDVYVKQHDYIAASHKLAEYEDTGLTPNEAAKLAQGKLIYESYQGGKLDEADQYIEMLEKMVEGYVKKYEDMSRGITLDRLREICEAEKNGRVEVLPCNVGETVYRICKCKDIDQQLDGTMHGPDGGHGTATGYYCPYEGDCPHDSDECEDAENIFAVFEDCVTGISIDEYDVWIFLENTPNCEMSMFGKTAFLSREEAESALKAREGK